MNRYVQLAKSAIEEYVKNGKVIPIPKNLPPEFYEKKYGVFVSIHKNKELRGCVGTYLPVHRNLAEEIISSAVAACSQDSRFSPVSVEELPNISVEVSLLSQPEKISTLKDLDPRKYGIIVKCFDGRCGLLLPDLEGVDTVADQLSIACQKGGIDPVRDKNLKIYRFTVEKH